MSFKAMIFDCDGTIMNSMPIWRGIFERVVNSFGFDWKMEAITYSNDTRTASDAMRSINRYYHIMDNDEDFVAYFYDIVRDAYLADSTTPFAGLDTLLADLTSHGVNLVAASGTRRDIVCDALEKHGLREYFCDVLSCEDVGIGKIEPKIYLRALDILGTSVEETVGIEDEPFALETLRELGMMRIGIFHEADGFNIAEVEAAADVVVREYSELSYERIADLVG